MFKAAEDGDAAALRRLIDAGGNVDERNEVRAPPSRSPSPRVPCRSEERARRLLPHARAHWLTERGRVGVGAASRRWQFGETALMYACFFGSTDCTELLLKAGANVEAKEKRVRLAPRLSRALAGRAWLMRVGAASRRWQFGNNALMFACINGHTDCAKLLLQAGAKVEAKDNVRASPLASRARWPVARVGPARVAPPRRREGRGACGEGGEGWAAPLACRGRGRCALTALARVAAGARVRRSARPPATTRNTSAKPSAWRCWTAFKARRRATARSLSAPPSSSSSPSSSPSHSTSVSVLDDYNSPEALHRSESSVRVYSRATASSTGS